MILTSKLNSLITTQISMMIDVKEAVQKETKGLRDKKIIVMTILLTRFIKYNIESVSFSNMTTECTIVPI